MANLNVNTGMTPMNRSSVMNAIRSLALICPLGACSLAGTAPEPVQDLALAVGGSAQVGVTTIQVVAIQDSRCPGGAACITAGDVVMVLAFSGAGYARTDTLRLNAPPKTSTYGGLTFQPTTVLPYPDIGSPDAPKTLSLHVSLAPTL